MQSNLFAPRGLWGALSWILLIPIHRVVFGGLLNALARRAEAAAQVSERGPAAVYRELAATDEPGFLRNGETDRTRDILFTVVLHNGECVPSARCKPHGFFRN